MSHFDGAISIDDAANGMSGGMPSPAVVISRAPRPYEPGDEEKPNVRIVAVGESLSYYDTMVTIIPPFYLRFNRRRLSNQGGGFYFEKRLSFFRKRHQVLHSLR